MESLSLRGKLTSLISLEDESKISKLYYNDTLKHIDKNIQVLIIENNTQVSIGYIYCYNYNSYNGYIYIKIFINDIVNNESYIEACSLLFNYIFSMLPIRKIYYETFDYEIDNLKFIKNIGFRLEANLKEDKFFNGKYNNKYILSLYRADFYVRWRSNE